MKGYPINDLKGFYKYYNATGFNITSETPSYTSVVLSSIPAGTYLVFFSAELYSDTGSWDCDIPKLVLVDGNNQDLNITLTGNGQCAYKSVTTIGQITNSSSFSIKIKYWVENLENSASVSKILILLLKVA